MNHLHQELQPFAGTDAVSGCWKLGDGRALTLRPTRPGVLRIAHGRVWITFDQAHMPEYFSVVGQLRAAGIPARPSRPAGRR